MTKKDTANEEENTAKKLAEKNAAVEKERQSKNKDAEDRAKETAQQAFVRACEELRANTIGMEQNEMKKRQADFEGMKQLAKPYLDKFFKHGKEFWSGAHAGYDQWESIMSNLNSLAQDFSEALMMQSLRLQKNIYHLIGDRFKASPTNPHTLPDFEYDIEIDKNNRLNIKSLTCDGGKEVDLSLLMGFEVMVVDWLHQEGYEQAPGCREEFKHKTTGELLDSAALSQLKPSLSAYMATVKDSHEQKVNISP